MSEYDTGYRFQHHGDRVIVDLVYPRSSGHPKEVEVGLEDTRAADSILISYDFERDGWSIKQDSKFEWPAEGPMDHDWQEVAFIRAWARDVGGQG